MSGHRAALLDAPAGALARLVSGGLALGLALGLASLALWSFAADWRFPDALPASLSLQTWRIALPDLVPATVLTLGIALAATLPALALVLGCLEAEARIGLTPTPRATSDVSTSAVTGRPADGISAEPGSIAYALRYASIGHVAGT